MKTLLVALRVAALTLLATGLAYPLALTGLAQVLFPAAANGSAAKDGTGAVVGSELVAQRFERPWYFQPRPSAAGQDGWDAAASSGSNLGPTSKKLQARAAALLAQLLRENPDAPRPVPAELVTASASGLDPHLSPEAALWQVARVAQARDVAPERVRALVEDLRQGRDWGVFGEPRVNVLLLNLALDRQFGAPSAERFGAPR
ncbi:MAG TPA: potassium-transporting ATPase subunit KdpC [Myxococcales bacterium]|jgi:K+-transporting ATPase ATPase C chain